MNPLKSSSSQQYNRIDNSHSNVILPCKRLPTTGDGNCLIHALFGEFSYVRHFLLDEVQQEFFHKNAPAVRFEIAHKLFNQGEVNHAIYEELYSIDELGSATFSPININNLALSLEKNGEYLGLEHAHLIAKAFKLNIRIYYPKSHAYEKIDLFHRDTNTQVVDRIVYFNGINHWEKCELSNEPQLPSSLDFVSQYSLDESTSASSRRSSFDLRPKPQAKPKYKQIFNHQKTLGSRGYSPIQRLETNTRFIQSLQGQINKNINGSYLFTPGKQEKNDRFQEVFIDFFREMRGVDTLVNSSGEYLANKFVTSPDMCKIHETSTVDEYGIDTSTEISPTIQLINKLKTILEEKHGLQNQFITALDKNGKRINDFAKLEDRDLFLATLPKDHDYRQKWGLQTAPIYIPLSMIAKLFPKCVKALKEIFNSLLITEWLQNDIDGVKLYLDANDYVDRPRPSDEESDIANKIWISAKTTAEHQKQHDTEIEAKHWNEFQNDLWGTMVSGGLSICTVNPTLVIGKAAHTMMNVISNQVDPEGRDKRVQVLKMFGGVGLGGALGGNPWDLGTSLGIDLVELAVRDKKTTKGESAALTLWGSILKGALTGDQKKLVCQILGGCVAEAVNQLPETDENTSLERRIARALLTNSDVQSHFIKGFVDKRFKDDPKPKTGGILTPEEQEKYPKQEPTLEDLKQQAEYEKQLAEYEQWEKDVKLYKQESASRQEEITQKETAVKQAETKMLKLWGKYQKAQGAFSSGDKEFNAYWKKRETYEKFSGELNTLKAHQGLPQEDPFKKFIRKPSPPKGIIGVLDRAYDKTCDVAKKIGFIGEVPVISVPLYTTRPSTVSDRHVPRETFSRPQVNQPRPNLGWENVQAMQIEQIFTANMQRSIENSGVIGNNFQAPNYQLSLVRDLAPNMQFPPTDFSNLGRNEIVPYQNTQRNIPIQMAGFVPFQPMIEPSEAMNSLIANDFTKSLPKGALKVMAAVFTLMIPDMSDIKGAEDPREHFKRSFNYGLKKYDRFVDIQDPNSFGAKAGEFVGEMVALGGVGKVIRVAEGISMIGMACEGGFVGAIMSEAHETNRVAGIAFGFIGGGVGAKLLFRGGGVSKPLLDRVLVRPQGYSKEYNFIRAFNNPGYRSGFVSEGTVAKLGDRNIRIIEQIETFVGKESKAFSNKAGDIVIESKDGLRQFRIDMLRTKPHKNPHSHVVVFEKFKNFKKKDQNIRIFPKGMKEE